MTRALRQELKMARDFARPEGEVMVGLFLTADALKGCVIAMLKEHGLSEPQYNVLRILRGAGEPLPSLEVGARMITRLPDITRLVDRLVEAGLARRTRSDTDRRVVLTSITPKGRRLVDTLDAPMEALMEQLLGHMSRRDLSTLASLLDKARVAVARRPA